MVLGRAREGLFSAGSQADVRGPIVQAVRTRAETLTCGIYRAHHRVLHEV